MGVRRHATHLLMYVLTRHDAGNGSGGAQDSDGADRRPDQASRSEGGQYIVTDGSGSTGFPSSEVAVGVFTYTPGDARLVWSDELFAIFGFAPHEIVPTLALMASHQDPQDRADWDRTIDQALRHGRPVSLWHRIVDTGRRRRTLLTNIDARVDGLVGDLRGTVADLTERLRQDHDEEIGRAVARSSETRAVIDQAKGVLMATMDLDETQAFELLRWHSSYTNMKLRDLSALLLQRLADPDKTVMPPRQRMAAALAGLNGQRKSAPAVRRSAQSISPATRAADRSKAVSSRISPELLPRTLVSAVEAAAVSISIADCLSPDWPLVYVNPAFERLTGYRSEDIVGRNCRFLQGPNLHSAEATAIKTAVRQGREIRSVLRNYRIDGTAFWNELHLSAVRNESGVVTHYIGYQNDISERVEREQQLEQLAYHDPVVDLPNEAAAVRHIDGLLSAQDGIDVVHIRPSIRSAEGEAVSAGDEGELLCQVAERLRAAVGDGVFLASSRSGGFLAVGSAVPAGLSERVEGALSQPIPVGTGPAALSATFGVATSPGDGTTARALIDAARTGSL